MKEYKFLPLQFQPLKPEEQIHRAKTFYDQCNTRRSVRKFSDTPVSKELIETLLRTAGTAPSGANKQPWKFVVVSDVALKKEIRIAAEKEERESYERRMPEEWLNDLEPLGTDWHKEFLEIAPYLIVIFQVDYNIEDTKQTKNYYVKESVGIATGFLLAAIHNAGLVALTHTPSPMNFLNQILQRPKNEKPFLLLPVGYPANDAVVPDIHRKSLNEILVYNIGK
ncbi:MAG: nitroreductase family protein [Ignavibacteriales bacterium]|nr:nitroreductase family protein [Ignavibacteriales bacterium]